MSSSRARACANDSLDGSVSARTCRSRRASLRRLASRSWFACRLFRINCSGSGPIARRLPRATSLWLIGWLSVAASSLCCSALSVVSAACSAGVLSIRSADVLSVAGVAGASGAGAGWLPSGRCACSSIRRCSAALPMRSRCGWRTFGSAGMIFSAMTVLISCAPLISLMTSGGSSSAAASLGSWTVVALPSAGRLVPVPVPFVPGELGEPPELGRKPDGSPEGWKAPSDPRTDAGEESASEVLAWPFAWPGCEPGLTGRRTMWNLPSGPFSQAVSIPAGASGPLPFWSLPRLWLAAGWPSAESPWDAPPAGPVPAGPPPSPAAGRNSAGRRSAARMRTGLAALAIASSRMWFSRPSRPAWTASSNAWLAARRPG